MGGEREGGREGGRGRKSVKDDGLQKLIHYLICEKCVFLVLHLL